MKYDAIVISDIHIGAYNCQHKKVRQFIHWLKKHKITNHLIIAGDGCDHLKHKKYRKRDWKVLKAISKFDHKFKVTWILGNHDEDAEQLAKLFKGEICERLLLQSGDLDIFITHGHQHDVFIKQHPVLTNLADFVYQITQMVDSSHKLSKFLKRKSKVFLHAVQKVGMGLCVAAKQLKCQSVIHGHNHKSGKIQIDGIDIWDSGCWTEKPCTFIAISNGNITLNEFHKE